MTEDIEQEIERDGEIYEAMEHVTKKRFTIPAHRWEEIFGEKECLKTL